MLRQVYTLDSLVSWGGEDNSFSAFLSASDQMSSTSCPTGSDISIDVLHSSDNI